MTKINTSDSFIVGLLTIIVMTQMLSSVSSTCNVSKCNTCISINACSTCDMGYTSTGPSCCNTNTIQNCASCLTNGDVCENCVSSSYCLYNSTCKNCSLLMNQCTTCSDCSTCLTCNSTLYAVNSSSKCELCYSLMDYCSDCTNQSTCTKCVNTSFAINSTSNRCQPCDNFFNNCTYCVSELTCIACVVSPNIVFMIGKCFQCGDIMTKCLNCTKFDNCTLCSQYYTLQLTNNTTSCAACINVMFGCNDCTSSTNCTSCSIGYVVRYGCSPVSGCTSVTQNGTKSICDSCNYPQYHRNPFNGICRCLIGHPAGKYCTQIIGCISVFKNGTIQRCLACSMIQHFQPNGNKCECRQYFQLQTQTYTQICGDGILYVLPCDDGNMIDGDGCSSACKIEKGYTCKRGAYHGISTCTYDGTVSLSLQSINNLGSNSASIVFQLNTPVKNFAKSNLTSLISFGAVNNCEMTNYQATSFALSIFIRFEANVENTNANITLEFDSNYINRPKSSLQFKMLQSNGQSLLYDPDYYDGSNEIITMPIKALSGLLWAALLFASYSHKMIGVETIHTVQLMLVMQACSQHYLPVVVNFEDLSNVFNVYQQIFRKKAVISSKRRLTRIGYSGDFITNISVVLIIQLSSILLFLLLLFVQKVYMPLGKSKYRNIAIQKIPSLKSFLYRVIIFPIIIGTYFHYILSLMIHSNISIPRIGSNRFLGGTTALGLTFSTFFIFFGECRPKANIKEEQFPPDVKASYVKFYLGGVFMTSIFIYMALIEDRSKLPVYFLAAAEVIISIFILFYRPYKDWIHTIGLILNFCGISMNIGWIISQEVFSLSSQQEQLIAFAEIGLIGLIIIWSIIRTVFEINKLNAKDKAPQKMASTNKKKQNKQNRHFQIGKNDFVRTILRENESHMKYYCLNSELLHREYEKIRNQNANQEDRHISRQFKEPQRRKMLKSGVINRHLIQEQELIR